MKLNVELLNRIDELGVFGALLGLLYCVCIFYAISKLRLLGRFTRRINFDISKFFVWSVTLCSALRAGSFFLIAVLKMLDVLDTSNDDSEYEYTSSKFMDFSDTKFLYHRALVLTLIFPDVMVVSTYALIVLLDAETFISCREHLHLLAKFRQKWFKGFLCIIPLFFVVQLALFLLFVSNWNTLNSLDWILNFIATANFAVPVMWIALFLYLSCKFAGFPFKSNLARVNAKQSTNVTMLWTICRLLFGVIKVGEAVANWYNYIPEKARAICLVVTYIITEILPFLISLSSTYLQYVTSANVEESMTRESMRRCLPPSIENSVSQIDTPLLRKTTTTAQETPLPPVMTTKALTPFNTKNMTPTTSMQWIDTAIQTPKKGNIETKMNSTSMITKAFEQRTARVVKPSEIQNLELVQSFGSYHFRAVYRGELRGEKINVTIAQLPPAQMTLQKGLTSEIVRLATLMNRHKELLPIRAVSHVPGSIWIVRDVDSPKDWLSSHIQNMSASRVSWRRRIRISLLVSRSLSALERIGRSHGSLSTHCVHISSDRVGRTAVKLSAWECRTIETFVLRSGGDPLSRVETRDNDNMKLWRRRDWSDSSKDMYAFGLLMWSVLAWKSLDSSVMSKFNSKRSSTTNDDIDGALDSPIAMSPGHRPRFDVEKGLRILKSEADEEDVQKAAVLIHNCLLKDSAKSLSFAKISKELENILSRKDGEDVLSVI